MRVRRFRVERYRSIEKSESIDLSTMSVLVGPNNEGKSNLLRALVVGLQALALASPDRSRRYASGQVRQRLDGFERYVWSRDFPLALQEKTPGASSVFEFEFEFNEADLGAFKSQLNHTLNGELKLRVLIDRMGTAQYKIVKKGPGNISLNANVANIASFITRRIRVEYIPISRTSNECRSIVRNEAVLAARKLLDDPDFQAHIEGLERLVGNALAPLEAEVLRGVQEFLPDTRSVTLRSPILPSELLPDNLDIIIDDGQPTSLSMKGDGVQSLIVISLIARLAAMATNVTFILAVEEPESHLHPKAIRKLRDVLEGLAAENQVILTTHSPVLVSRDRPSANILVAGNQARPVAALSDIRESLGVELPDNLSSADLVLVVEGKHDVSIVRRLLAEDRALSNAMKAGRLAVQSAGGAQHVPYHYRVHRDGVVQVHVLLDDDKAGRTARQGIDAQRGFLDVTMTTVIDMNEAEIEDLFDEEEFRSLLLNGYNVTLDASLSQPAKRFSLRMKDYFNASGQSWNESVESNLKVAVARVLSAGSGPAPIASRQGVVDALQRALRQKLGIAPSANLAAAGRSTPRSDTP